MCPARDSAAGGRETQGRLSWGHTFFAAKERVRKKRLKIFCMFISLLAPKKRTKEKAPSNSACGFPHKRHVHGGGTNSHNWALRQRAAGTRAHAFCSASLQRVFKTQNLNHKKICRIEVRHKNLLLGFGF